jgi:hypothetical protein
MKIKGGMKASENFRVVRFETDGAETQLSLPRRLFNRSSVEHFQGRVERFNPAVNYRRRRYFLHVRQVRLQKPVSCFRTIEHEGANLKVLVEDNEALIGVETPLAGGCECRSICPSPSPLIGAIRQENQSYFTPILVIEGINTGRIQSRGLTTSYEQTNQERESGQCPG